MKYRIVSIDEGFTVEVKPWWSPFYLKTVIMELTQEKAQIAFYESFKKPRHEVVYEGEIL